MFAQLKLYALAAVLLAVVAVDVWIAVHQYNKGWKAAIAAVAAKDQEALNAVNKSKSDVDACYAGGRSWSTVDGVCQ
jgi:uncharacterized protein (UPF0333 family)